MKILFVWTGVTSYMADCWRELARKPDIELKVVIERHSSGAEIDVSKTLSGFDVQVVSKSDEVALDGWMPNIIFAVGWHSKTVRAVVTSAKYQAIQKVCCFTTRPI